jgi:hypothetical protein
LVVLAANAIYLLHISDPNPINQYSGIGTISQAGLLPGNNYVDPNVGFTAQALGHRAALDWLHGQVPWWNPYEGVGAPLAGEMQSAAFFPLDSFNLLPTGQIYFRIALEFLAGVGTYLLVRRFTRSNLPAVVAGAAFALNGTFAWMFHAPANPIAFLPFLLLGIEWAREGARSSTTERDGCSSLSHLHSRFTRGFLRRRSLTGCSPCFGWERVWWECRAGRRARASRVSRWGLS